MEKYRFYAERPSGTTEEAGERWKNLVSDLTIYYGFELMEVVPDQREHVNYKLLVARLYNAGVKARTLQEVFELEKEVLRKNLFS